ncbi:zinc ribbon domain-containing protein [Thiorhodococcus mannitoliphagus]|uniref:Zinc ribbon domain-containing protein n=1 Tax=Thiorhodococcus mannitoliphagus TaxID=329406 RepID=A0A6P1E367_9GAMM|nr:zinc ribbon domain-containing protein [Thiorhodococcus mannitoliphagus]NEX23623.1 zinc ribbon domain-containing protein [Thiorhodococcus mannitoliphagus]
MKCPKCSAEQDDFNQLCDRCGIVFEKYYKYHPRPGEAAPTTIFAEHRPDETSELQDLLLPKQVGGDEMVLSLRAILWIILVVWGLLLIFSSVDSNAAGESFLHLINLPFHEAGHVLFRPFGEFITSLGGTLGQLLMPVICLGTLLIKTRDPFGASVCLWWFGENFLDIAPYIADARAGVLPLVGGNTGQSSPYGFHDWEYLLTETGLLRWDTTLGTLSHLLGALIMILAAIWGLLLLRRHYQGLKS